MKIYKHGTETAKFLTCSNCESYIGTVTTINNDYLCVITLQYLKKNITIAEPYNLAWSGDDITTRLDRGSKTWTPARLYSQLIIKTP